MNYIDFFWGTLSPSPARGMIPLDPSFAFTFPQGGKVNADAGSKGIMPLAEGLGRQSLPKESATISNVQRTLSTFQAQ